MRRWASIPNGSVNYKISQEQKKRLEDGIKERVGEGIQRGGRGGKYTV